jgi:hypothetical protein
LKNLRRENREKFTVEIYCPHELTDWYIDMKLFSDFYYASICEFLFFFSPLVGPFLVYIPCIRVAPRGGTRI